MTGVFPSVLKTAKVVPVFKKDSKLDCSNCRSISLFSNIAKIFEKRVDKQLYTITITIISTLFITHSSDLDNNILHLIP